MNERFDQRSYKLEWIKVKHLSVVWVQAQRKYTEADARRIADQFDPELFDPLKVTLPNGDGTYHICDGQHRKNAIEMKYGAEEAVPCLIAPDGDPARAAQLFLRSNRGRRPPDMIDDFKVSVVAKEQTEVAIDRIVRQRGYRVDRPGDNCIASVGALKFIYTACGPKVLDDVLQIVQATWNGDRHAVGGSILRGYGSFMNEFGSHANWQRLKESVSKKYTPGSLLRDAKAKRDMDGCTITEAIVRLLVSTYNRGLRTGKPLKRKEAH